MSPLPADAFTLFIVAVVCRWMGRWLLECSYSLSAHRRRAYLLACFVGGMDGLAVLATESQGSMPEISLEGLFSAGINGVAVGCAAYFAVAVLCLVYEYVGKPPLRIFNQWRLQAAAESSRQEQEHRRSREQQEWSRAAPERERAQREAEERRQQEQRNSESNRQRRENARLRCLMLYDRHATELEARFSRERLESYFATYLTDQHPPEAVEERAKLLEQLIEESAAGTNKKHAFQTLDDIAAYFRTRAAEIQSLPYDDDVRDTLLTLLNKQEEDTIRRFLTP